MVAAAYLVVSVLISPRVIWLYSSLIISFEGALYVKTQKGVRIFGFEVKASRIMAF
ncbi:hypothetical protein BDV26DRAFT_267482 [Aspergillus bertholletiae]|uniref:Uncharacterized protein n=1 Tax=Aspergillus bertholletiae TaxID=1226010 RepID=A0A5N7B2M4_9EURO|nr:hypothetical protein BDV26DRAFT_267482 [Aspergillus bertholletiae]